MEAGMKLKSFFASSVEEAMGDARREFGPEAVLVQSRRAMAENRQLGEYEVVCALLPENEAPSAPALDKTARPVKEQGTAGDIRRMIEELAELNRCMRRLQTSIVLAGTGTGAAGAPVQVREALAVLLDSEVDADLAQQIVGDVSTHVGGQVSGEDFIAGTHARFAALVHRHVMRLATTRPFGVEESGTYPRSVALAGPPGAGKTSCIAKLAARHAIAMHRGAHVVSLDEYRVGGSEQLRAYAAIFGVGFDALTHDASLSRILEEQRNKLILIDLPGFSHAEMDLAAQMARRLRNEAVEVQLVLPASLRAADLRRISEGFRVFEPAGLIFTRLDETETYGPLLNEIVRTGKAASFLSGGSRVPDDIEPATRARLADLVLSGVSGEAKTSWAAA
jgi:flagellar biosynthesis protein FlhF